jgi:excinuclease ABC subunit B
MDFKLHSNWPPSGDQPKAIGQLAAGIEQGLKNQTLLGVTGSGKTFTIANVIQKVQKPTLVIAHNKTLAAQLCSEFRQFFPENAVEYFVSYYDYYQPEAYMPRTDTYIEKEAMINEEIDRLRHSATQAILSRRDVIIVASVSCIYSLGSPKEYEKTVWHAKVGDVVDRQDALRRLVDMYYERTNADLGRGQFRAHGDVIEIMPKSDKESVYRLVIEGQKLAEIFVLDPITRKINDRLQDLWLFPAKHYVTGAVETKTALKAIEDELAVRLAELEKEGKVLEHERLSRRTRYDLEMIRNIGYCNGIENYSRHFDGRKVGEPPFSLIEYFPKDFLTVIDESHVSVPQIGGMYAGDQARKSTLVEHGFRLPSAKDNRPLTFTEFEDRVGQTIFVSATPGDYERAKSSQIVEQIVRPTGLVDPETIIRPVTGTAAVGVTRPGGPPAVDEASEEKTGVGRGRTPEAAVAGRVTPAAAADHLGQVEDLIIRIKERIEKHERTLVTTLTKKMAEDLTGYLEELGVKVQYLHSDVDTLKRIEVLTDLRKGVFDVVVGVNLLREGLDLPEVSLVAILDADKEGFLRSETSLIQTIGRAARHLHGQVVLYADQLTGSIKRALKETDRRRKIQLDYNQAHHITPTTIIKEISDIRELLGDDEKASDVSDVLKIELIADPREIADVIKEKAKEMDLAAANLMFETAAVLRDEIVALQAELKLKKKKRPKP